MPFMRHSAGVPHEDDVHCVPRKMSIARNVLKTCPQANVVSHGENRTMSKQKVLSERPKGDPSLFGVTSLTTNFRDFCRQ